MATMSERTCWADGHGYTAEQIEALTLVSEEAERRGLEVDLPAHDLAEWIVELSRAGADDLVSRVREVQS
jgi:ribosomal protein L13E